MEMRWFVNAHAGSLRPVHGTIPWQRALGCMIHRSRRMSVEPRGSGKMGRENIAAPAPPAAPTAAALRRALDSIAPFLQGVGDGILVQDRHGHVLFVNDVGARACGFDSAAAMRATPIADVLARFDLRDEAGNPYPIAELPAQRVLTGRDGPETVLRTRLRATGEERWSVVSATPVRDARGAVQFAVSIFRDITARRRAEVASRFLADASAALAESLDYETTLQRVTDLAVPRIADWCAVEIVGEDGALHPLAITHVDPAKIALAREFRRRYPPDPDAPYGSAEALRTGRSQLLAEIPDALLVAGARDADHLAMLRAIGLSSSMLVPLIARGKALGTITFISSSPERRYGPDDLAHAEELARRAALAIDNARLYREAQASEERFRGLFEGTADAVLVTDAEGRYVDANPAMCALVGYSRDELRTMRVGDLSPDWEAAQQHRAGVLRAGAWRGEMELRRKDGAVIPVEGAITALRTAAGAFSIAAWRDISGRRRAEEQRQRFIAMVAHELRNPLSAIIGYADLMRRRQRYDAKAVETIVAQARRLERLTLDLRETMLVGARALTLKRGPTDPRALVTAAVELAQATSADHRIVLEVPAHLPAADWDADRVSQALGNLLLNAIKYSEGGTVRVQVNDSDGAVRIAVTDTGMGIPPEAIPQIFEPFYRATNAAAGSARGMGLGLPIAKALIEAHGGTLTAASTLGVGSTFIVTLPYTAATATPTTEM